MTNRPVSAAQSRVSRRPLYSGNSTVALQLPSRPYRSRRAIGNYPRRRALAYMHLNRLLTNAGAWLSRPLAVAAVGVFTALWLIFDWESFNWQAVASVATLLMTLFIQRSEHRDTQAIHAKLDELLRMQGEEKNHLATLDDKEPEQIEAFRKQVRAKLD